MTSQSVPRIAAAAAGRGAPGPRPIRRVRAAACSLLRAPAGEVSIEHSARNDQAEHERRNRHKPEQNAAEKQPRAGAGELAAQIAIIGVANLEAFEARLRP